MFGVISLLTLMSCDIPPPSSPPAATPAAVRPAVRIDQTWTARDGEWTFTGAVDPQGDPTDVVLEIGPGPATLRQFDSRLPVAEDLVDAGALTITTRDIPELDEICVRFTATNSAGSSSATPLCFPHAIPSFAPAAPAIRIDPRWTAADGEWTFTGRLDPGGVATDVVLEIGRGPATAPEFETRVPAGEDLTEQATLTISTGELPDSDEVCVRFMATNSVGTASSDPLCFSRGAPGSRR